MKARKLGLFLIGGVLFSVTIYAVVILYLTWPITIFSVEKSGAFGDSFGLLTSLFSGLAFAGLILTIVMQKEELALQREELSLTRKELTGQKEELKIQNLTMKQQQFENTFFQMLSLHNEILKSIDIDASNNVYSGRDAFSYTYGRFNKYFCRKQNTDSLDAINEVYINFYVGVENELGHYFRNLFNIIKFVDKSDVQDKKLYTNLIRAQLSSYELALIFFNCLSEMGRDKFKPLIEKYCLLKNIPEKLISEFDKKKDFYSPEAYS